MASELPGAAMTRKVCPFISDSQGTVFCKGEICYAAYPQRFMDETFWFCSIIDGPGGLPETGDNDR
ncbi:MAG: hypothetical protein NTV68_15545 [Methanomicrobiales archaeon]|jgi:hypothetical protein|nr:hypothetical protein [Methanomicrobiales archaeon]